MTVWEKVAAGTLLNKIGVLVWLNKNDIKACELEREVNYLGNNIKCTKDCNTCLKKYLGMEIKKYEQMRLFE